MQMKTLGHAIIEQMLTESPVTTVLVIYPGRFQPMGQHHAAVYKKLASKFGKSNTFVVTSDKVTLPKSPLNFKEKYLVMKKHGVTNVIPGDARVMFNFRYSTETTKEELQKRVHEILDSHKLDYTIDWSHSGYPFLTPKGELVSACIDAIQKTKGIQTELSTAGGTSDGRFIAKEGTQVVELGPVNKTIHQVNESVLVQDLDDLSEIYYQVLTNILA